MSNSSPSDADLIAGAVDLMAGVLAATDAAQAQALTDRAARCLLAAANLRSGLNADDDTVVSTAAADVLREATTELTRRIREGVGVAEGSRTEDEIERAIADAIMQAARGGVTEQ